MPNFAITLVALAASLFLYPVTIAAEPIPVELRQTENGWQLYRGGEPYFIRGAGGAPDSASLEALAAAGANSVRTWDAENIWGKQDVGAVLDAAQALGMTVTVGLWLGHERHGFDYSDPAQVSRQKERVRQIVLRHRDHPALLLWGLGNEMEGYEEGDNPDIWGAVNDIAEMVRQLDPNHPTMTVTAFVHGERIDYVHKSSPGIDIHGINAYGGALVVPERLVEGGATKPYLLTEFGPVGPWEMPTTDWGAPYEQTSTEKAAFYRKVYEEAVLGAPGRALGSYAFLWGHKMEGTATWFGMFTDDGARTAVVDTMTELWTGSSPENRAPGVERLVVDGDVAVEPGEIVKVRSSAMDSEGEPLTARWVLRSESGDYTTGGDFRPDLPDIDGAVVASSVDGARVRMPDEPGAYRLFLYVYDEAGNAATANVPLLVKGDPVTRFPVSVYEDRFENMPWAPSGWMGSVDALTLDGSYRDEAHDGVASIRIRFEARSGWAGIAWQHPPNNWGDMDGGFDLTGATELEVWARGELGGERVSFGVGLPGRAANYPDSDTRKLDGIELTSEWQRYVVPLRDMDLSSIKTGFVVTLTARRTPVTIYLDSIRFVR